MPGGCRFFSLNRLRNALAQALVPSRGHFIEADYRAWRNVVKTQNLKIE